MAAVEESDFTESADALELFSCAFPALAGDLAASFLSVSRIRTIADGDTLCTPDAVMPGLEIVASGTLVLEKDGHRIRDFQRGDYLGEGSLIRDNPTGVTVRAAGPTRLLEFPRDAARTALLHQPDFGYAFLRVLMTEAMARLQATNELYATNRSLAQQLEQTVAQLGREMDERRRSEDQMRFLATHDTLTNLGNRALFWDRLHSALARGERYKHAFAVIIIDLDLFKDVNDVHGHSMGDKVLVGASERLKVLTRGVDAVARIGGDEFAILQDLSHLADRSRNEIDAASLAERVLLSLAKPFFIDDLRIEIGCSVGIALFPEDGSTAADLMRNADLAMYRAKTEGRNCYRLFTAEMGDRVVRASLLKADLRSAVNEGLLRAHYQPKISIDTGEVVGLEALARWEHRELGPIAPDEFIPIAEQSGIIAMIGEWMLHETCRQMQEWRRAGLPVRKVAVNLSPLQFRLQNVVKMVEDALRSSGLPPDALELEVTENVLVNDADSVLATLDHLRERGVTIAVDDFGIGYSSLSYLKRFGAATVKIDRSFIRDCDRDPGDRQIVRAIVSLAHSLDLEVVAEGVDNDEQLKFLRKARCDVAQGFLFGRPMPADGFRQFIDTALVREVRAVVRPLRA